MCPDESDGWNSFMDTVAKRLAWALNMRKIEGAAQAGRLIGIPESTMRTYLLGTRGPPLEQCEKIGAALRINPRWLHKGEGTPEPVAVESNRPIPNAGKIERPTSTSSSRRLTLYYSALAGPLGEFILSSEQAGTIAAPPLLDAVEDAYAVHIVGESMTPRYEAGEVVFVHPWKPVRRGDYVVVQLWQDDTQSGQVVGMVKRLVAYTEDDLVLSQWNPPNEFSIPRSRVKSVHRVVGTLEG